MYVNIQKNVLSIVILAILYISLFRKLNLKENLNKVFLHLIMFNIISLFLDTIIISISGTDFGISKITLLITGGGYFFIVPVISMIWIFYADIAIFQNKQKLYKLSIVPLIIIGINLILVIFSFKNGYIFSVNSANVFIRGPYAYITTILSSSLYIYAIGHVYINRNLIRKKSYYPLLVFGLPPLISAILLIILPDMNFVENSLVISQLLIYINIQSRITSTDFLTGLYNRREYEFVLKSLHINKPIKDIVSGIVIDINGFKKINDTYGHRVGDEALVETSNILKNAVRKQDYVFRVGGDEFTVVILSDDKNAIHKVIDRINEELNQFNMSKIYPFDLSFSIGKGSYDQKKYRDIADFFEELDLMMYHAKKTFKEAL